MDYKRQERINVFENTIKIINGNDFLQQKINESIKATKIYNKVPELHKEKNNEMCNIKVINTRSLSAIDSFSSNEKTAVLNFASATNPGGGVKNGSSAQEECLCRCTTLYPVLNTKELFSKFYLANRKKHDMKYSSVTIYTPDIYIIKSDVDLPKELSEDKWKSVDIITCAAPNLKTISVKQNELLEIHKERAKYILNAAIDNGVANIVLGAFGCGAFNNNPEIVARAYKEVLINEEYGKYFNEIIFAVLGTPGKDMNNFNVFNRIFKNYEVEK